MKIIITLLLTAFFKFSFSQSSYVYKRNLATGQLEVFESRGGLPTGQPLFKIKKNVYGYLEVENVDVSLNPFTRKPDYEAYNNFKPYQLPAKEIFNTIETLNKRNEFDYSSTLPQNTSAEFQKEIQRIQEALQNESAIANSYLTFYNSNISFPSKLKDGWYEVVNVFDSKNLGAQLKVSTEYGYNLGICKVENNKVSEYYRNCNVFNLRTGFVFQKEPIDVASPIISCKTTFRKRNSNDYTTLYFLDNILDSTKQIESQTFAYYSIFTPPNFRLTNNTMISVQISRNRTITQQEVMNFSGGPYSTGILELNPQSNDCKNSALTLAFRNANANKFSIGIFRVNDKKTWILNDLSFISGYCDATLLKE